jgi:hypothetical protein
MLNIQIDLSEFSSRMKKNVELAQKAMTIIVRDVSYTVANYSKLELYPGHGKITGQLRRSIKVKNPTRGGMRRTIGPSRSYASFIESKYGYMEIGARKTAAKAQTIAGVTMRKMFGGS